jgi:hypothetical protein
MHKQRTILALFKDTDDEALCSPLLVGIPEVIRAVVGGTLAITLENLKKIGIEPRLTVFSSRLYPGDRPDLVAVIRKFFPAAEILLISAAGDPFPPLQPLAVDRVRHLAINPAASPEECSLGAKFQFFTAVTKLVEGRLWEVADYVETGTPIHEFTVSASAQKEVLIAGIETAIRGDSPEFATLRQRGALLADEMLENAMYGAPRGEDGNKLFRKGELRRVLPRESIVFRFGYDGQTLAMEVADGWGSLSPDLVLNYLATNQDGGELSTDAGGRGLFIIWRFFDQFHVIINPGRQTVVGGHVRVSSPLDPEAPKGFHISARP